MVDGQTDSGWWIFLPCHTFCHGKNHREWGGKRGNWNVSFFFNDKQFVLAAEKMFLSFYFLCKAAWLEFFAGRNFMISPSQNVLWKPTFFRKGWRWKRDWFLVIPLGFLPKGKGAMKCDAYLLPFGKLTWKQHMKVWKMIFVFKGLKPSKQRGENKHQIVFSRL